jgi:Pyruvate/2-oxoacid:ferredoxin oxidoreductase delta subunit
MYKTEYHLHTAENLDLFADLLLDLCETCRPTINVMDAVVGMEGAGPSNGTPRHIGLVAASKSYTALDYVAATIVGFAPLNVPTIKRAHERNIGPKDLREITVFGEQVAPLIMSDFEKTITAPGSLVPYKVMNRLRRFIGLRPRIDPERCRNCGQCAEACPPEAMSFLKTHGPRIDYDRCIRCYCCQEMCPEGAITVSTPLMRRLLRR